MNKLTLAVRKNVCYTPSINRKEEAAMFVSFAYASAFPFAQSACAAFSCPNYNSMIILDASFLLASIIILPAILICLLVGKKLLMIPES